MTRVCRRRSGFALLAVLWMLGGGAVLGMLLMLTARDARGVATNRIGLARARWIAEGCLERARAAVDEAAGGEPITDSTWAHLGRLVHNSPLTRGCTVFAVPTGTTLDVNTASESRLRRLFAAAGASLARTDSLTGAILDWRDPDDDPQVNGAERAWYESVGRASPRNAAIASSEELASIRGMEQPLASQPVLGVEPGRIALSHAPRAVLATLPGITTPALDEIDRRRSLGDSVLDIVRVAVFMDSTARDELLANLSTLGEMATALPDAWLLSSEAESGSVPARLELRVVRSGRRLAILRRRSDS